MTSRRTNIWHKKVDGYSLLLAFFFIFLLLLMGYLYKIDHDIRNYDRYRHRLDKMRLLTYKFDNVFQQTYRYINYDSTSELEKHFQGLIDEFDEEPVKKEFGPEVYTLIIKVKTEFNEILYYFEDFKALNARVTNSIYYLYDLHKTLERKLVEDKETQILVDNIFFSLSQILMQLPYDEQRIQKDISLLQSFTLDYPMLVYFIQHTHQFLKDAKKIAILKEKVASVPLRPSINRLLDTLEMTYRAKREQQRIITISLFGFAFMILGLLIFSYRRIQKNAKELQAFRYAIEQSDNAIMITNRDRQIEYVNYAFEEITGYTQDEVQGKNPNILKSGEIPPEIYKEMNEVLERGEIWQGELINRRKNGEIFYEKSSIIPVIIDGELVEYLAIKLDVTAYKKQQKQLKLAGMVYDIIGDGVIVMDKEKRIISVNPAFCDIFGYTAEELIGKEPMVIRTLKEDDYFYRRMWDQLLAKDRWSGKLHNRTKDGKVLPVWLTLAIVRNEAGEIENFIAIYTNLEEIIATQERAEYLAYHDSLTGLPNRAYFDLRVGDALEFSRISQNQIALFFLDLDRFKVINDTLGHAVGDEMLKVLSKRILNMLDDGTLFARTGGDEFVILHVVKHGRDEAAALAEKILSVVREPIEVHDYRLNISVSIGIAIFPDDAKEKYELLRYADSAMYAAKEKGKDAYQFYNRALSLAIQTRLNIEQELVYALERHEMKLHYQPKYLLEDGSVSGVEALLRWHSISLGTISPAAFISIAEETGMIVQIGYFVFEEACKAFMRWRKEGLSLESIAVNVSAVQFRDEHFIENIAEILQRTGMPAEAIEVEITEHFIMEYSSSNMTVLEELRALGCVISIDDFGTGYSSMSYLKQLPIDIIKIDRSFISDIPQSEHDEEVTRAIIVLAHSLGYKVVAEGIETVDQERFLKDQGAEMGQGFYFAKPMDEVQLLAFLQEKNRK